MTSMKVMAGIGMAVLGMTQPALAGDKWYPFKVYYVSGDTRTIVDYVPLARASKLYRVCVVVPHMKDSGWVAVAYGLTEEAKDLGINLKLYEAGGYENLPKQLSQFDDCMASGADAIIVGAISEAGLTKKFDEARAKGIPVVGVACPTRKGTLPSAIFASFNQLGLMTGEALIKSLKPGEVANVVTFPGPAGSGWAEDFNDGFKKAVAGDGAVKILDEKFGDTGVATQLQLIQDSLQAYPQMNVIWGSAPTAEAAIGAVAEAGRPVKIISTYENQALLDALKRGEVLGFGLQYAAAEGRIAVDQAVRLLDKQPTYGLLEPVAGAALEGKVDGIDFSLALAPADWMPVYSVKQR